MSRRHACIAYCIAHFGKSLLWTASDLLTLYLLVSSYAVDPMIAGGVFLAGLAANALADLAVGIWLGRHPRQAAMLAGFALALAALAFPATVLLAPKGAWALLAATLMFRIAYAGCDVPHNALLTRLGRDPVQAIRLARGRTVGTALASLIAAWVAGGGHAIATAPLLWMTATGAFVIGVTMVPLLIAFPPETPAVTPDGGGTTWLPLPFLAASVVGIVALGALGKAVLHLPMQWARPDGGTAILTLLIVGRTGAALIPMRAGSLRGSMSILAAAYAGAAVIALGFVWSAAPAMLALLGLAMGATNLIGWAILPALARGPGGYGLYTMASKLALGAAGLALAGGLGRVPTFTSGGFVAFALGVALACLAAALLTGVRLTPPGPRAFSKP